MLLDVWQRMFLVCHLLFGGIFETFGLTIWSNLLHDCCCHLSLAPWIAFEISIAEIFFLVIVLCGPLEKVPMIQSDCDAKLYHCSQEHQQATKGAVECLLPSPQQIYLYLVRDCPTASNVS